MAGDIKHRERIAVIGQGVMGLTSAARLLRLGFAVDIYSRETFSHTTSMAAGAYWWPHKAYPEERVSHWAKATYEEYRKLRADSGTGVTFEKHFRFCLDPDENAYALNLTDEWQEIKGADYGIPCAEAYLVVVPVIDVPAYMPYLKNLVESDGAKIFIKELSSPAQLFPDYDLVVNLIFLLFSKEQLEIQAQQPAEYVSQQPEFRAALWRITERSDPPPDPRS